MPKQLFKITNKSSDTIEIDIDGDIGESWGWFGNSDENTKERIKQLVKDVANSAASHIIVNINSYGGDVNHGISIHDILAEHKAKVTTIVHGHTASAATIIAQAGNVRKMSANSLYLVHPASLMAWGNQNDLKLALADLEKVDTTIAGIYAKRTGKTPEEIREIMNRFDGRGEWLTATEAKELGFIDEIFEPMKAVASADPKMLAKFGLPTIPTNKIQDMKADKATVTQWFNELIAKMGLKPKAEAEPAPEATPEPEAKPEATPEAEPAPENVVVIRDLEEVRTVLNDFVDQVTTRDATIATQAQRITALEAELAQAKGLPTKTEDKDDPAIDPGKTVGNAAAAEKNAESLKTK